MANLQEIEKLFNENSKNNKDWGEEVKKKGAAYVDKEKFESRRKEIEKELKDLILEDLSVWELGWEGELAVVSEAPVSLVDGGSIKFPIDYQKEIIRAFIEEIKQNPQDWKIEIKKEHPTDSSDDYQVVKHKSGRKHYRGYQAYTWRPGFSDEEWKEIEKILKLSNPSSSEQQLQQEQLPKEVWYKSFLIIVMMVASISLLLGVYYILRKRKG
ncbi:MAG: hypothetical protein I3273_03400 [Candidatus Moeniiplasma glomeromycotorum]|nr:hypothetical protein [Candidatus Moeniiplasma glomeromycotorum]MCE8167747.1 hypothetical protein [Candidatus Moeniiplasma glomeromycotorum]MCE8169147.1 hypothetical protein [Candidatus Moeniiplasma glomeromycotorum]